jgi:hypothetical protein
MKTTSIDYRRSLPAAASRRGRRRNRATDRTIPTAKMALTARPTAFRCTGGGGGIGAAARATTRQAAKAATRPLVRAKATTDRQPNAAASKLDIRVLVIL